MEGTNKFALRFDTVEQKLALAKEAKRQGRSLNSQIIHLVKINLNKAVIETGKK